ERVGLGSTRDRSYRPDAVHAGLATEPRTAPSRDRWLEQGRGQERAEPRGVLPPPWHGPGPHLRRPASPGRWPQPRRRRDRVLEYRLPRTGRLLRRWRRGAECRRIYRTYLGAFLSFLEERGIPPAFSALTPRLVGQCQDWH